MAFTFLKQVVVAVVVVFTFLKDRKRWLGTFRNLLKTFHQ